MYLPRILQGHELFMLLQAVNASTLQELRATTEAHDMQRQELDAVREDHESLQQLHRQTHSSLVSIRSEHEALSECYKQNNEALMALNQHHQV